MTTARYAVLLRGVNVGRAKRIAMADLRALLTALGYSDVRTHLNSGNAVLSAERTTPQEVADRVREALADRHGFEVGCPDGVLAAPQPGAALEKHGGLTVTARNWNTVAKLDTLLG